LFLSPAPGDYTAITSLELTFSNTMPSQTVPITIADGDVVEGLETFTVTLTSPDTAVTINPMTATVDILDEDSKLIYLPYSRKFLWVQNFLKMFSL